MPIPIVTIPEQGAIATRPRRQPLYDTEGDNNAVAIQSELPIFINFTQFYTASLAFGPSKVKGRDHNMDSGGKSLSKGDYHHWYAVTCPVSARTAGLTTAANAPTFEEIHRIRQARWFVFKFGETPFIRAQLDEVPGGVGTREVYTSHSGVTVYPTLSSHLSRRENRYDVTLDGYPTEITDLESFYISLFSDSGFQPTPTNELYWSPHLWGTLLKGIRG